MTQITDLEQHQVYLGRLATQLLNANIYPSYTEAYKAIRLILLDAETIGSLTKLNAVNRAISQAIAEATTPAWQTVGDELTALAVYESAYYVELIGGYAGLRMKTPPKKQVEQWMSKALMALESGQKSKVGTWGEFVDKNQSDFIDTVQNIVKSAYINGDTTGDMVKRARETIDGLIKRNAETLVRTGSQFYAVEGREAFADYNKDLLASRMYWAVLDNRTTLLCAGRHTKKWPMDAKDFPPLPAHFGCRSIYIFLVDGQEYPDGFQPAVGGKDTEAAREEFERKNERLDKLREKRKAEAADGGKLVETPSQVRYKGRKDLSVFEVEKYKAGTKYDDFLRKQPDWFIEDTLGPTRAKLFKDGGLSMSSFTDMTGRTLRLDELQARDRAAFVRAGLIAP